MNVIGSQSILSPLSKFSLPIGEVSAALAYPDKANDDGHFSHDPTFSDSLADEYNFGVSFLDIIGY